MIIMLFLYDSDYITIEPVNLFDENGEYITPYYGHTLDVDKITCSANPPPPVQRKRKRRNAITQFTPAGQDIVKANAELQRVFYSYKYKDNIAYKQATEYVNIHDSSLNSC